jgi:hypothetical protein
MGRLGHLCGPAPARGDLTAAQRWADDAVAVTTGWHLLTALATRARVAIATPSDDLLIENRRSELQRAG